MALADWTYNDDGWSVTLSTTQKHSGSKSVRCEQAVGFPQAFPFVHKQYYNFTAPIYLSLWVYFPAPLITNERVQLYLNGTSYSGTQMTVPSAGEWHQYEFLMYNSGGCAWLRMERDGVLVSDLMYTNSTWDDTYTSIGFILWYGNDGFRYIDDVVIRGTPR